MRILYHMPSLHSIYAHRTIYNGYRNAFIDLGHEFRPLTADDDMQEVLGSYRPDLFITSSFFWHRRFIDYQKLRSFRSEGVFVLTKIDFWNSPLSPGRINEAPSLSGDKKILELIEKDLLGDAFFHGVEQEDERMHGFEEATGRIYHTIPLACDATLIDAASENSRFYSDLAFIGTNLPEKRAYILNNIKPLKRFSSVNFYGQDWTWYQRILGWMQRFGQYLNIPFLRTIQKPKYSFKDECSIYKSAKICINIHEDYQRIFGGDCNERAFKIPGYGGFQICDDVACIGKYFEVDKEIIIAKSANDWLEKTRYYLSNEAARNIIVRAGQKRVMAEHTYHHRARQMLQIAGKEINE